MSIKKWAQIGKEVGLDGIDFSITFLKNHTPVYLDKIKEDVRKSSMLVVMITTYPDFTHPDAVQRERELMYLKQDIAVASYLEAKYLRIVAGQAHPETKIEDGIKWVVENFKKNSPLAEKFGVKLVYENHAKPGAWKYTDFSQPTDIFLEIAERIKDTAIGINFDTADTIAYGDNPIPVLKKIVGRVETVHAADTKTKGEPNHVLLGTGLAPFEEIFKILKDSGFDNWICIEENSKMGVNGIIKSVEFIKKLWEEV